MRTVNKVGLGAGSAGIIACCVAFLPAWEGMDKVARRDAIGTGHPVTYCYGQTAEFGNVKPGTRFTKQECDQKLAESLPHYLALIDPCINVKLPDKTYAAFLDAAYNAGPAAVCRSPMVKLANAGRLHDACNAFAGWYIRSAGQVRRGLVARRGGDGRKGEKQLCLEGMNDGEVQKMAPKPAPKPKHIVHRKPKQRMCVRHWWVDMGFKVMVPCSELGK